MFEYFRKHTWLLQVILGFVVLAFVGGGVYQGYGSLMNDENSTIAKVDGAKITRTEFDNAQRNQIERARAERPDIDPKVFDTPEAKRQTLDSLIQEHVLQTAADKLHLTITDERLARVFATDPQFAGLRNPDGSVNRDALAAQGMTPEGLVQRLRPLLSMRQVTQGLVGSVSAPVAATSAALDAMFQQREVQVQRFSTDDAKAGVNPSDAEIEAYYKDPANASQFQAPESANIEYVVLDLDSISKGLTVSDQDLQDYYKANLKRYTTPEERRVSHILVKVDPNAPAADQAAAKSKAEALLAQVKKDPASFAELARKNSDDKSSAAQGGDLDFAARGGLPAKSLEDAVFALKPNEIGPLVQSEFGYHIVEVTAIRGGETRPFDAVKAEIEKEVKTQLARKRFADAATEFTNTVYEQSDSLKPVVDKLKLDLQTAQDVKRTRSPNATGVLANPKFLDALFSQDAIRDKHNTQAIEVGPNSLASGRIVKYEPAHQLPLAEVKTRIHDRLVVVQAAAAARKAGQARLAQLRAAPSTAMSEPAVTVSRATPKDLSRPVIDAVLKAPTASLPAFVGIDLGDAGYAVAKIDKVLGRDPIAADANGARGQYAQAWGDAESQAYYSALKSRLKVDIKPDAIGKGVAPTPN